MKKQSRSNKPRQWQISLTLESRFPKITAKTIKAITRQVLSEVDHEIAIQAVDELHILITDDPRMQTINLEHRGKDKPTDVLSFPQFTPAQIQGRRKPRDFAGTYLGDLVVSRDTTIRQAKKFEVTVKEELVRLIVHGILHLCGYDHEGVSPSIAQKMRRRERVIRSKVLEV